MLFNDITTEEAIEKLKRSAVNDKALYSRIISIRRGLYSQNDKTTAWIKESAFAGIGTKKTPTNAEMLALYKEMVVAGEQTPIPHVELLLKKIKTRSNSGVAVVSLLTKPYACPGKCIYCPTEKNMPKSYLSKEPAAARALRNKFDPYEQVYTRLRALALNGHPTDKLEIIVIGGTWSFYHPKYQEEFIGEVFRACNNFHAETEIQKGEKSFAELLTTNESASCRVIGLSVETRPDYINEKELARMRSLGVTKVEIGVQHLDNGILAHNRRDMTKEDIAEATELLRNAGFKVVYHMMPNLPGSDPDKDKAMFTELFAGVLYQPDMLKIYPCMVLKKSLLYKIWARGGFRPYTDPELLDVLVAVKKKVPPYVRIIRVIRDIPATYIIAGSKISNLRQHIVEDQKKNHWQCQCIRCREIRSGEFDAEKFKLSRIEYRTQTGTEIFLSYENTADNKLAAFLRLRLPDKTAEARFQDDLAVLDGAALVRELHTYGHLVSLNEKGEQSQHRGLGKSLLEEAERIAKEQGFRKMAVISGIGVRDYYRKRGYELDRTYMVKSL